jgi:multidrug efflux system outer membrane protein
LQRRPDIAESERLLAARAAELGVAEAAWFPTVKLTAAAGYESSDLADLLRPDSLIWSMAGALVQPLFDGGRNRANVRRAKAAYKENFAQYRERLLVAFQEVENALGGLRLLDHQYEAQSRAVDSADKSERLASARYKAGLVSVLDVIDAQRTHLQAQRNRLFVRNQQMLASVALIRALGGGWQGRG